MANDGKIQLATGLDKAALLQRLATKWTMEHALRDSVERTSQYDIRPPTAAPFVKLMHIENMSMQSLARSTRGVGVGDLREALEGRSSMSNPNLVPSIRTYDHPPRHHVSVAHDAFFAAVGAGDQASAIRGRSKSMLGGGKQTAFKPGAGGQDVRDMLNRIVGPGKANGNSGSMLKSPFSQLQKRNMHTISPIPSESSPGAS